MCICIYICVYKNLHYIFSSYKEQINKQMEIVNRKNYIENQLRFENEFNRVTEFKGKFANCIC